MQYTGLLATLTALSVGALAAPGVLDARQSCSTSLGSGVCQSTSTCTGFVATGACPGGSTNLCCIQKSCSTSRGTGKCRNTSYGCSGGSFVSGACPGGSDIQCCVASSGGGGGSCGGFSGLSATQSSRACAIIGVVRQRGLGRQGCLAGISTAVVESSIQVLANNAVPASLNYAHDGLGSDHDSIGIFQQRASIYTNIAADMDPAGSAGQFFDRMVKVSGWQTKDVGELDQAVQGSAYPTRYNEKGLPVAKSVCSAAGF